MFRVFASLIVLILTSCANTQGDHSPATATNNITVNPTVAHQIGANPTTTTATETKQVTQ